MNQSNGVDTPVSAPSVSVLIGPTVQIKKLLDLSQMLKSKNNSLVIQILILIVLQYLRISILLIHFQIYNFYDSW